MQVALGLPEPRVFSLLPRLKLVQAGVQRTHALRKSGPVKVRLPITPLILKKMRENWSSGVIDIDTTMLWAASVLCYLVLCYFGFFRSGEITVPSQSAYQPGTHLSRRDVALDNPTEPAMIRVILRRSKTDQLGKGVAVFVGKTGCDICPVSAVAAYMVARGNPIFQIQRWKTSNKIKVHPCRS